MHLVNIVWASEFLLIILLGLSPINYYYYHLIEIDTEFIRKLQKKNIKFYKKIINTKKLLIHKKKLLIKIIMENS